MNAAETLAPIMAQLATRYLAIRDSIEDALNAGRSGTMRAWCEKHNGQAVTTVQVDNNSGSAWCPTGRTINATRASSVLFNDSARYYAGMRVIGTSDRALVVEDEWHTIAYVIEGAE